MRLTIRSLAKHPAYSLSVIVVLMVAIGGNAALFALIDTILLEPLPYPRPQQLVAIHLVNLELTQDTNLSAPAVLGDWNRLTRSFTQIAGSYVENLTDTDGASSEHLLGARTSPGFFAALGTAAAIGRLPSADEERFGGPSVVVVSDRYWRGRLHADRSAVGRTITLAERGAVVIGVMPPSFQYPAVGVDVWVPAQMIPDIAASRTLRFYRTIGRVRDGVPLPEARANLAAVQAELGRQFPRSDAGWTVTVAPLKEDLAGEAGRSLWLLFAAVGFLLLIGCGNIVCLMLAEAARRDRDTAMRVVLGASRWDVVRQLMAEGLVLALLGAGAALIFISWTSPLLQAVADRFVAGSVVRVGGRVMLFTMAVSVLPTLACALVPARQLLHRNLGQALTQSGRTQSSKGRAQRLLVMTQIALTCVLLVGASLLLRSVQRMQQVALGFEVDRLLAFRVTGQRGEPPPTVVQRQLRTLDALKAIPTVSDAAIASPLPAQAPIRPSVFRLRTAASVRADEDVTADLRSVSAGYFQTLGVPILAGTTCTMDPAIGSWKALVNQRFVDRFLARDNPLGQRILEMSVSNMETTIIGVVGDAREDGILRDPQPTVYFCGVLPFTPDPSYLVRTRVPEASIVPDLRAVIHKIEPNRAVYAVRPMGAVVGDSVVQPRLNSAVLGAFAAVALVLAVVGLYGVLTQWVHQRRREMGVRLAMGASPARVLREVMARGAVMVAGGLTLGLIAALWVSRLLMRQLFGVRPSDPVSLAVVSGVIAAATVAACFFPARRAAHTNPLDVLREE